MKDSRISGDRIDQITRQIPSLAISHLVLQQSVQFGHQLYRSDFVSLNPQMLRQSVSDEMQNMSAYLDSEYQDLTCFLTTCNNSNSCSLCSFCFLLRRINPNALYSGTRLLACSSLRLILVDLLVADCILAKELNKTIRIEKTLLREVMFVNAGIDFHLKSAARTVAIMQQTCSLQATNLKWMSLNSENFIRLLIYIYTMHSPITTAKPAREHCLQNGNPDSSPASQHHTCDRRQSVFLAHYRDPPVAASPVKSPLSSLYTLDRNRPQTHCVQLCSAACLLWWHFSIKWEWSRNR